MLSIANTYLDQYRPPGRSARSGRTQNDNDVFEGLPVKQWGQRLSHVSLAPPKSDEAGKENDKWAEPPMPRDSHLLHPWTQHLLRLARSGKVGTKRKPDPDMIDDDKAEDEVTEESKNAMVVDRGYVAKKWKPVPEAMLEPEHKHFEFLAKRRRGMPSMYGPEQANAALHVPMRRTKVQRQTAEGETVVYDVLVPEGQVLMHEIDAAALTANPVLLDLAPVAPAAGTTIEGLGVANEEGVIVAEHLRPSAALGGAARRNRPPPKKKGGPGRGKKRVTFTNPDGSTYTTVVPNATKIVPQPGQTVKHVAKGEEPGKDISAEEAAKHKKDEPDGEEGGEGEEGQGEEGSDEEGSDEGDDDGREEGELSDDDAQKSTANATPVPAEKKAESEKAGEASESKKQEGEDVKMEDAPAPTPAAAVQARDPSSSPETPLAKTATHSRQASTVAPTPAEPATAEPSAPTTTTSAPADPEPARFEDGDEDLLGSLENSLNNHNGPSPNGPSPNNDTGAATGEAESTS
ncbi:uncharacterized protein LTR77_009993 [Saxophila tyrrhenica]|uniref:Uncharacterized protein n=1 Tax=Saxophila tyrrhenica TaxID=1690608 RepID=A0AAV9P0L9_9PEZI|nr:hypothetical protein LTR77_009993 [Saxophila tyrrhenica]